MKRLFSAVCIVFLITGVNSVTGQSVENITQIRFGSSGDPLNGLTVTWRSKGTADKIAWGYTTNFEQGEFQGLKREQKTNILFDYTFPALSADSTMEVCIFP